ncbi:hypothetical protein F5Y16DRAFT_381122 [Xylariaceae sp. FL0255]|nr:hypothetical protein F5Y16DRAFT_381122 [Xylariaceae sp. FL0255]
MLRGGRFILQKGISLPTQSFAAARRSSLIVPKSAPKPVALSIQRARYASKPPHTLQQQGIDPEQDRKIGERKLAAHPESVTTQSSVRHLYEPDSKREHPPVHEGVKDDLGRVKDALELSTVPKEPYFLGLAGTLPYLGTSASTVYLSWVLNTTWPSSSQFLNSIMISHDTAKAALAMLEPIQLGYGAVIISFLGAIHWGLEYAEKKPDSQRARFRYGTGVMASVVAWPTLFMPVEFALTGQFAAFVALYFADARATVKGWAPSWYSTYRFILTAVVGVAIVLSLIGRAKVGDAAPRLSGLSDKFHAHGNNEQDYTEKWRKEEDKERERLKKEKEKEEKKKAQEEETKDDQQAEKSEGESDKKQDDD